MKTLLQLKKPNETDLIEGSEHNIYTNWKEEESLEGTAILLEQIKIPKWRQSFSEWIVLPWIKAEIGEGKINNPIMVNWSAQRWRIKFIDGPNKGHITSRYIPFFYKTGIVYNIVEEDSEEDTRKQLSLNDQNDLF